MSFSSSYIKDGFRVFYTASGDGEDFTIDEIEIVDRVEAEAMAEKHYWQDGGWREHLREKRSVA